MNIRRQILLSLLFVLLFVSVWDTTFGQYNYGRTPFLMGIACGLVLFEFLKELPEK